MWIPNIPIYYAGWDGVYPDDWKAWMEYAMNERDFVLKRGFRKYAKANKDIKNKRR